MRGRARKADFPAQTFLAGRATRAAPLERSVAADAESANRPGARHDGSSSGATPDPVFAVFGPVALAGLALASLAIGVVAAAVPARRAAQRGSRRVLAAARIG